MGNNREAFPFSASRKGSSCCLVCLVDALPAVGGVLVNLAVLVSPGHTGTATTSG